MSSACAHNASASPSAQDLGLVRFLNYQDDALPIGGNDLSFLALCIVNGSRLGVTGRADPEQPSIRSTPMSSDDNAGRIGIPRIDCWWPQRYVEIDEDDARETVVFALAPMRRVVDKCHPSFSPFRRGSIPFVHRLHDDKSVFARRHQGRRIGAHRQSWKAQLSIRPLRNLCAGRSQRCRQHEQYPKP